jgi:hypothetical protein
LASPAATVAKPSNKLLAVTDLDSDTWVAEVKRIRRTAPPRMPIPPARDLILRVWDLDPLRCPVCQTPPAHYRRH